MSRVRNAFRDAPQGIAPAVFLILALLVAARSVGSYQTGTTARMGGHIEGTTVSGTGIALTITTAVCVVLAVAALVTYLSKRVIAARVLIVLTAITGLVVYALPSVLAVCALILINRRLPDRPQPN
jgi:hypothetical protein